MTCWREPQGHTAIRGALLSQEARDGRSSKRGWRRGMFRFDDIRVRLPMTVRATSGLGEVRITCRQIVVGLFQHLEIVTRPNEKGE